MIFVKVSIFSCIGAAVSCNTRLHNISSTRDPINIFTYSTLHFKLGRIFGRVSKKMEIPQIQLLLFFLESSGKGM
jgi:hypothetical protein